eukprot:6173323-Pleurochrysis_carterae.AAC.2
MYRLLCESQPNKPRLFPARTGRISCGVCLSPLLSKSRNPVRERCQASWCVVGIEGRGKLSCGCKGWRAGRAASRPS